MITFAKTPAIMDARLLPLIDLAENGDVQAQIELAEAFNEGLGVKRDDAMLKYYLLKISTRPDYIGNESYGGILTSIGDIVFDEKNYDQAADWYIAAIQVFRENFSPNEAEELIEYYEVEKGLEDAFFWSERILQLQPENEIRL